MLGTEHHISDYDGDGKIEVLMEKRAYGPLSDSVNQLFIGKNSAHQK